MHHPVLLATVIILLGHFLFCLYRSYYRLKHIPGPIWARLTNLQRVWWVQTRKAHEIHQQLHEKYGISVRLGPNMVSISDPEAIPVIYPARMGFPKSDFYRTQMPYSRKGGALPVVFNTRDEHLHKQLRSPIASLYSMTNAVALEPFVDKTLSVLFEQLDSRFVKTQCEFDLGNWLQYFAFEVMGTLSFSKRYGFLENGCDTNGLLESIWAFMKRVAPMGQIPWFDEVWYKNWFVALFRSTPGMPILRIVDKHITARQRTTQDSDDANKATPNSQLDGRKDMLSQFLETQATNPAVPSWAPRAWTFSNVIAGSDSTGNVMRTVMYNIIAHPQTLHHLRDELQEAQQQGNLSQPFPTFKQVQQLPYLDACVREALRIHPPFCLPFERVVPASGITICGTFFPPGTVVGMSPYVVNRHKGIYGEDADLWRPERWLECDQGQRQKMENSILTFGSGRRTCLGKNIAILEIMKLVPALTINYEMQLVDPARYQTENYWFFRQWGLDIKMKKKETPLPALNIPASTSTVDVRVIDPGTTLDLNPSLFWEPPMEGLDVVKAPDYSFLISNGNRHVLFDLGMRNDWENLPPKTLSLIKNTTNVDIGPNIADVLDSDVSGLNICSKDIEAIIWSHHHFDHTGDPSTFPESTTLVVGPGVKDAAWPGYPTNTNGTVLDSDIADREVREISFSKNAAETVQLGPFDAHDYFGDGSFYLLDAPGHSVGHLCGLARVTTDPDTFVFMGGDCCHHVGVLRPSRYLQLPFSEGSEDSSLCAEMESTQGSAKTDAFFRVSPALTLNHGQAVETVEKIKALEGSGEVFVILAHDGTLQGQIDFYPEKINDWKQKGYDSRTRWLFCKDLKGAHRDDK